MVNYTPNLLNFRTFIWYFLTTQLWKTPQQRLRRKQLSSNDHNTNTTSESLTWKEKKRRWEPKKRKGGRVSVSEKKRGSTGWMSHRPQSVNEPADPCNKLLGRTAELEICRHSQNKKNKKEREREREKDRRRKGKRAVNRRPEQEKTVRGVSWTCDSSEVRVLNKFNILRAATSDTNYQTLHEQKPNVFLNRESYKVTFYFLAGQKRPEWSWRWRWRAFVVSRCQTHACQLTNTLSTISFSGSRKFSRSPIIPPLVPITWTNKSSENEEVFLFILMDRKSFIKSTNLEAYHHHVDPRQAEL